MPDGPRSLVVVGPLDNVALEAERAGFRVLCFRDFRDLETGVDSLPGDSLCLTNIFVAYGDCIDVGRLVKAHDDSITVWAVTAQAEDMNRNGVSHHFVDRWVICPPEWEDVRRFLAPHV